MQVYGLGTKVQSTDEYFYYVRSVKYNSYMKVKPHEK